MGSICTIFTSINRWQFLDKGYKLKTTGEPLYVVRYGIFDDDILGVQDLEIFMRKSIADNLLKRKYIICRNSSLRRKLIILDEKGNAIKPFKEDFIY